MCWVPPGHEPTQNVDEADLILFNTCSVRERRRKSVLRPWAASSTSKKKGVLIGVGGCVASQEGEEIIKRTRSWMWCSARKPAPPARTAEGPCRQSRRRWTSPFPRSRSSTTCRPARGRRQRLRLHHGRLLQVLQLLRGARYTRGEEVSRPFEDVLVEVAGLADQGVKEVTLLGQNVNAYRGKMGDNDRKADFALLLEYVAEIPGIERIRYTTSHPKRVHPG